ncbi:hypothetical protein [Inquilinus limosus]|uniref:hypothetical protein n=1 Tax=Inquilinus limosus TaxID=171674 RepID=UPI00119827E1|nr:hypothetical protein [Inquilinus limosus]
MIKSILCVVAVSTAAVLCAPAFAATPEQCKNLADAYLQALKYQGKGIAQAQELLRQELVVLATVARLKMQYPEIKDEDLDSLRNLAKDMKQTAGALTPEGDPDIHQRGALAIHELCP